MKSPSSVSESDYRAEPAFHYSGAKLLAKSPATFKWNQKHRKPQTDSQALGSAIHALCLQGEAFYEAHYQVPPMTLSELPDWMVVCEDHHVGKKGDWVKAGKEWKAEQEALGNVAVKPKDMTFVGLSMRSDAGKEWKARCKRQGITPIAQDTDHHVRGCVESVMGHPLAGPMIREARDAGGCEVPVFAEIEGVKCKCLVDIIHKTLGLGDLKSCGDVRPESFNGEIGKLGYHWQAALYLDICEAAGIYTGPDWRWITVEPEPPYCVGFGKPAPLALLEVGRDAYLEQLRVYKRCLERDEWPNTTGGEVEYDLRGWMYYRRDEG
jgi:hypothetical protein